MEKYKGRARVYFCLKRQIYFILVKLENNYKSPWGALSLCLFCVRMNKGSVVDELDLVEPHFFLLSDKTLFLV